MPNSANGATSDVENEKNKGIGARLLEEIIPKYYPELMMQGGGIFGANTSNRTTNYNV